MRALVVLDLKPVDGAALLTDRVLAALEPELARLTFDVDGVTTSSIYGVRVVAIRAGNLAGLPDPD